MRRGSWVPPFVRLSVGSSFLQGWGPQCLGFGKGARLQGLGLQLSWQPPWALARAGPGPRWFIYSH